MAKLDGSRFEALTFDCYGTLIDWHGGIAAALAALPGLSGADVERLVEDRERIDFALIQGPYLAYGEILERSLEAAAALQGRTVSDAERRRFAESMGSWPPFPESAPCLRRLGARYRLAVLSNVERETLEASVEALGVPFEHLVTADEIESYKPARAHFDEGLRRLGLPGERVLHVAQSPLHDHRPAQALGLSSVWVNRANDRTPRDLASVPSVRSLAELCDVLGA